MATPREHMTECVERAMNLAIFDKLEDGSYAGQIPDCRGVVAFGITVIECEQELRSTLEEWILMELERGSSLFGIIKN